MPINKDRFEEIPENGGADPAPGTNAAKILSVLRDNSGKAFTQSEIAAENLSFDGEEYVCAALTLSDLDENLEVGDDWLVGSNPGRTSYCSPWVLATVKHDAVANPQGKVTEDFTRKAIRRSGEYLAGDVDL